MQAIHLAISLLPLFSHAASEGDQTDRPSLGIDWVLPGDFELARARSLTEQRLLLIKGVSFGIDEVGAVCASKGEW